MILLVSINLNVIMTNIYSISVYIIDNNYNQGTSKLNLINLI